MIFSKAAKLITFRFLIFYAPRKVGSRGDQTSGNRFKNFIEIKV